MAKTSTELRNEKRKKLVTQNLERRNALRKAAVNMKLSEAERDAARIKLQKMPRDTSASRVRNRCQVTGRSRGVYRKFMLSRIKLREFAHRGLIPGVTKASW